MLFSAFITFTAFKAFRVSTSSPKRTLKPAHTIKQKIPYFCRRYFQHIILYSKDEASQLKQEFWTAFGQYLSPILSADGLRVNWVNYKTGLKHVYFRMQADKRAATIGIEIAHPDPGIQELFFEQFMEYKNVLHAALGENWFWELHGKDEYGKIISRIYRQLDGVSIFNKNDWPELISFLKPRMIALDEFWSDAKYGFDALK